MKLRATILYSLAALACVAALVARNAHAAGREALQDDPSVAGRQFNMIRLYVETRQCMVSSSYELIRRGHRKPEQLMMFALAVCSSALRTELVIHGGYTLEEAEPLLRYLATESAVEALAR